MSPKRSTCCARSTPALKELVAQRTARVPRSRKTSRPIAISTASTAIRQVKFMPRDWTGPSFKGRRFSECPPPLLEMLAETFDYFASRPNRRTRRRASGKPVAPTSARRGTRAWLGEADARGLEANGARRQRQRPRASGRGWGRSRSNRTTASPANDVNWG
jgi:hypothetical protein